MSKYLHPTRGFTLIELIMVIVITGILAVVVAPIVSGTFNAYTDSSRRATLVQQAQSIVQRIQYDLSYAVPSSVSVNGDTISWLALTRDPNPAFPPSARYTSSVDVSSDQTSLPVLGCAATPATGSQSIVIGDTTAIALVASVDRSSCSNTPPSATITLDEATTFDANGIGSPFYRLYLTTGQLNIDCTGNQLLRFAGTDTVNPTDTRLLAGNIEQCGLTLNPGTTLTAPTLLIDITLQDEAGEQVRLVRQLQLSNAL